MNKESLDKELNACYKPYVDDTNRYLILMGGAGSGKSHFAAQKMLWRITSESNHRLIICRKVARTIRNSQYQMLKDVAEMLHITDQLQFIDNRMEVSCKETNSSIISTGLDDPEKIKSIARPTGIWIEEATEMRLADFNQLDLRLRGITELYAQIILSFNPISKNHWLYDRFFVEAEPLSTISHTTFKDNRFLDDHYLQVLEGFRVRNPNYYKVYGLGEWGENKEGLIYQYKLAEQMPECDFMVYGLDFGFNNPTALVQVGVKEQCIYVKELLYKTGLTTPDIIEAMKGLELEPGASIYADSADPSRIAEINRNGFNIHKALKEVLTGIDYVKRFDMHVLQGSTHLIKELDNYSWKQDMTDAYLDVPEKLNDHACDALRYALHTHLGGNRQMILAFT